MTTHDHNPAFGPGPELQDMLNVAARARPASPPISVSDMEALLDRVYGVWEFSDLSVDDQQWLNLAVLSVCTAEGIGDYAAQDAAWESGTAMPVPNPTVIVDDVAPPEDDTLSAADLVELATYDDEGDAGDLPDADSDGWVGL